MSKQSEEEKKAKSRERNKRWRENNKERQRAKSLEYYHTVTKHKPGYRRNARLKAAFGITKKEYDAKLESQGFACAGCGTTETEEKAWPVDHDHKTGAIRSILCTNCNIILGHAHDDPVKLRALADYLEQHGRQQEAR